MTNKLENRFKPAKYEPKEMPRNKVWMHDVSESKTGGMWPIAEAVLIMVVVFGLIALCDYLGWIELV